MPRTPFVAGNWKMNTNKASAVELAKGVAEGAPAGVQVGVAPPFVYLDSVGQALAGSSVLLGAQDVYFEKNGAFTGEISVEMLKNVGVKFCLTGHSERRHVLNESSKLIDLKSHAVYAAGLILVHCVGETLEQRHANQTFSVVHGQLEELSDKMQDPERVVIAYEPVWAIGTGHNATEQQAQEVHAYIRDAIGKLWIQYGGSMKPENAKGLLGQTDVDGGLIGGAALKADSFLAIVNAALG
jgi:triosephosphate isomerase